MRQTPRPTYATEECESGGGHLRGDRALPFELRTVHRVLLDQRPSPGTCRLKLLFICQPLPVYLPTHPPSQLTPTEEGARERPEARLRTTKPLPAHLGDGPLVLFPLVAAETEPVAKARGQGQGCAALSRGSDT